MLCPTGCGGSLAIEATGGICTICPYTVEYHGKVLDFVRGEKESHLDVTLYDQQVKESAGHGRIFGQLTDVLGHMGGERFPVVLEIGSGTGAWTLGLDASANFDEVYATDLSLNMLRLLSERTTNDKTHLVCQSAENMMLGNESVDLIVGRSILHHILDYRRLLEKCGRWLRRDGLAVFYEPSMQGKAWVAFFADLLRRLDTRLGIEAFSKDEKKKLERTMRHILKDYYLDDIERVRPDIEDKHIFEIETLRTIGSECGFSAVNVYDDCEPKQLVTQMKAAIGSLGVNRSSLSRYDCMFEAFTATIGLALPRAYTSPMVFFALRK